MFSYVKTIYHRVVLHNRFKKLLINSLKVLSVVFTAIRDFLIKKKKIYKAKFMLPRISVSFDLYRKQNIIFEKH